MPDIREITELTDPDLAMFAQLTNHQLRNKLEPEKGIFIAEGASVIELALKTGYKPLAFLMEKKRLAGFVDNFLMGNVNVPIYVGDRDVLAGLTGYKLTRGILCALTRKPLPTVQEVCAKASRLAVMSGITDSVNVGAIFRSAAALNIDGVLVMKSCCDPLCRRSIRVSMGTIFQVPWTVMEEDITVFHQLDFKTAALALSADAVSIEDPELARESKLALLFGSEGYGLPQEIIASCDYVVKIPMAHHVDSLNVAAAGTKWNFLKFAPGLVGGHCIGVDPYYLTYKAEEMGYHSHVILAGRRINDDMGKYVAENLVKSLIKADIPVRNAKIGILGITFKENCPDARNSKVADIIKELREYWIEPLVYDPVANKEDAKRFYNVDLVDLEALNNLDGIIIAVAHKQFSDLDSEALARLYKLNQEKVLLDIKGTKDKKTYLDAGYLYWRL